MKANPEKLGLFKVRRKTALIDHNAHDCQFFLYAHVLINPLIIGYGNRNNNHAG